LQEEIADLNEFGIWKEVDVQINNRLWTKDLKVSWDAQLKVREQSDKIDQMNDQIYWSYEHRQFLEQGRKDIENKRDQAEQERDLALNKYAQVKDQLEKQGFKLDEEEISSSYSSCDLDRE